MAAEQELLELEEEDDHSLHVTPPLPQKTFTQSITNNFGKGGASISSALISQSKRLLEDAENQSQARKRISPDSHTSSNMLELSEKRQLPHRHDVEEGLSPQKLIDLVEREANENKPPPPVRRIPGPAGAIPVTTVTMEDLKQEAAALLSSGPLILRKTNPNAPQKNLFPLESLQPNYLNQYDIRLCATAHVSVFTF